MPLLVTGQLWHAQTEYLRAQQVRNAGVDRWVRDRPHLEAYSWLITHMQKEALPAIMVIAGDDSQFRLVTDEHD